ncbi:MAG: hypothetical protein A3F10_04790 [Coxiella sp. RIFCSPHIGHO2_12_FULL_42_15]|nr:MAG: hypothetical protein A3F10_04790 [Coxiella sp. RIFCSPHIGHO2_12_FULL_42_15]
MSISRLANTRNFNLRHYIHVARFVRWPLNLFLIPGFVLAIVVSKQYTQLYNPIIILAVISLCFSAFANYTINEFLDAKFDALHPEKKFRPGAQGLLQLPYIVAQYLLFIIVSLTLAWMVNPRFALWIGIFQMMGICYNVNPIRTKDKPYLDILSESVNHPLRFICGWTVLSNVTFPPIPLLIACWMAGAFLMTIKRYAEYRHINNAKIIQQYRASFKYYNENKLLVLAAFFSLTSTLFLGGYFMQSHFFLLYTFPFYAVLFAWYTYIGMMKNSPAQHPEDLYKRQPYFVYYVAFLTIFTLILFFVR